MTPLVSLEDVRLWIPAQPEDEPFLQRLAELATGAVMDYCTDPSGAPFTWTEATTPDPVKAAILTHVAEMWAHRGDGTPAELLAGAATGRLSPAVTRYLERYAQPVVS
jgi:hypothetical protein